MIWVAQIGLLVAAAAALWRLVVGPTLADRVIALDLLLISLMTGIAIDAGVRGDSSILILLVVIAIIGFTATVAATSFIEREAERTRSAPDLQTSVIDGPTGEHAGEPAGEHAGESTNEGGER